MISSLTIASLQSEGRDNCGLVQRILVNKRWNNAGQSVQAHGTETWIDRIMKNYRLVVVGFRHYPCCLCCCFHDHYCCCFLRRKKRRVCGADILLQRGGEEVARVPSLEPRGCTLRGSDQDANETRQQVDATLRGEGGSWRADERETAVVDGAIPLR